MFVPTKSEKAIFSTKVTAKVTRSLTLVSFQNASREEYACQYEVSISDYTKVIANVEVDNRQIRQMQYIYQCGGIKTIFDKDIPAVDGS